MKYSTYGGSNWFYDNPYFIMLFFAIMFGFFIFFLIKADNKEDRRQTNTNIHDSTQKLTYVKPDKPIKNEALEIIKIRYAKGEINEEEFEKIKNAVM